MDVFRKIVKSLGHISKSKKCSVSNLSTVNLRFLLNPLNACRDGFRGGDLVTCHPLFSEMTLQSQILVIESLFLTSVSKFIRKYLLSRQFSYMYSSCSNPTTFLVKFSDNFFQEKLSTNESSITGT